MTYAGFLMAALRERKKAALRSAIVRSAVALFIERGFDSVGMDDIAERAICSRSTLNRYFGSKEDVLFGMAPEITERLRIELEAAQSDDKWSVARNAATALLTQFVDDIEADIRTDVLRLWHSEPVLHRRYLSFMSEWEDMLGAYFADGVPPTAANQLRAQLLSTVVASALRSVMRTAIEYGEDLEGLADEAFGLLESGLATPTPR